MKLVETEILRSELATMAEGGFGDLVKAVVDVERRVMVVGGEMHSDEEASLLASGSDQINVWGINLYPGVDGEEWIEFDSMINVRPALGNRSRGVEDKALREKIIQIVQELVQ